MATSFVNITIIILLALVVALKCEAMTSRKLLLRRHSNGTENIKQVEYLNTSQQLNQQQQQQQSAAELNNRILYNNSIDSSSQDSNTDALSSPLNLWQVNNFKSIQGSRNFAFLSLSSPIMPPNNDIENTQTKPQLTPVESMRNSQSIGKAFAVGTNSLTAATMPAPAISTITTTAPSTVEPPPPPTVAVAPPLLPQLADFEPQNQRDSWPMQGTVVYEGPATAPPPGDYYFSASETSSSKPSNIWWALGAGHGFEAANNLTRDNYMDFCAKSILFASQKQRSLCRTHYKIIQTVAKGLKMAIEECQFRFASSRWNCSVVLDPFSGDFGNQFDSFRGQTNMQLNTNSVTIDKAPIFGEVMNQPNREKSFLNAIMAAGIAHAITKACSKGDLLEECSCDKRIKSENTKGKIEWVGCSDDIDFGAKFSREFTDSSDSGTDPASMINSHNYEVGRRIFKMATDITCSCQGGENSHCTTKRCWRHLSQFKDIGDELIKRYDRATHVQPSNKGGDPKSPVKLRPVKRGVRKPRRRDLVFIEESPDFCSAEPRLGILGTQNRRCNSTSSGLDECKLLCCGRGYQTVVEEVEEDCDCKFVWCCEVKCRKCRRQIYSEVCN